MTDLILHHYDLSPYAEKIRLILGFKGLAWRSVQAPMVMPKADHVELTGGYRRVPVLQIGADVYCDTHCIARVLERLHPEPTLMAQAPVVDAVSRSAEATFMMAVLALFGLGGVFPAEFVEDRRRTMVPPGMDLAQTGRLVPTKRLQIRAKLEALEALLADGRSFLLGGSTPTLADFSAYHPLLLVLAHPQLAALLEPLRRLPAWAERMRQLGHGRPSPLEASEAIAIARASEPAPFEGEPVVPDGMALGDPVVVVADEYGSGAVAGALAPSALDEIAVRREGERAGTVVVHFPREEYSVIRAG